MRLKKSFNNNAALAEDDRGVEVILLGKGIAFQKKKGDEIDESKIEKKFTIDAQDLNQKFEQLFADIPVRDLQLTTEVISLIEQELGLKFGPLLYMSLSDHISYAIERYREGSILRNPMRYEIRRFYPKEYEAGRKALQMIEYESDLHMEDDEAAFITMHIVNAQQEIPNLEQTVAVTKMIRDILQIVEFHYHIRLDENSINFSRFMTHLQYFARRMITQNLEKSEDDLLFQQIARRFPEAYECTKKVAKYLKDVYEIDLTEDEMTYFMLHIHRVVSR